MSWLHKSFFGSVISWFHVITTTHHSHIPILCHNTTDTGWRRLIVCLKLQVISRQRVTKYRDILRKMTCKDMASYGCTPPCSVSQWWMIVYHNDHDCNSMTYDSLKLQDSFADYRLFYRALLQKWLHTQCHMALLQLVGSLKLQVSFADCSLFYRALLQKWLHTQCHTWLHTQCHMAWLRLVGSLKLYVSFAEYSLFYRALLQKRHTILRILLTVANP